MNDDLAPLWPLPYLGSALRSMRDGRREGMLPVKKLVVGPRGGSAGPPHGEHRSARPYCRRCAPGLNWSGRSFGAIIAIVGLQRGIPSKRESSARVDYVPALCTHRPSLLPIEWSGEVFGSRRRGRTTRERVIKHQREGVWSLHCTPSPPCPGDTGTRVPVAKRTTPGVNYAKESE
ncbi:hypothetical protein V6N13_019293 [Hibiscus sabdariffa]